MRGVLNSFNQLDLPEYSSYANLQKRLLTAINEVWIIYFCCLFLSVNSQTIQVFPFFGLYIIMLGRDSRALALDEMGMDYPIC